jgi:ABC-type amino acid transport substrate-binding protein
VANELDWPPFDFKETGTPKGLGVDYIKLLAKKLYPELVDENDDF